MLSKSSCSKFLYALSIIVLFPFILGFSLPLLDHVDVVAIRDAQLTKEKGYYILSGIVTVRNTSQKILKLRKNKLEIAFPLSNTEVIKLAEVYDDEILIKHQAEAESTDTDIQFSINLGSDIEPLRKAVNTILELPAVESKQNINLALQGSFDLGIQAEGGWVYEERIEIDWVVRPEIERTVLENLMTAITDLLTPPTPLPPPPIPTATPIPTQTATPTPTPTAKPTPTVMPTPIPVSTATPTAIQAIEVVPGVKLLLESLEKLKKENIPAHIIDKLKIVVNKIYSTIEDFRDDLNKVLGAKDANRYGSKIEGHLTELAVIYFKFDQSNIENLRDYPKQLESLHQWVKAHQYPEEGGTLHIDGHTDSRGTDAYNIGLSKERAESVYQYLMNPDNQFNVKWERGKNLVVRWFGESRLVSKSTDEKSHQKNRRVELFIIDE